MLHAAAPCPVEIKRQVIEWLGPIVDEYYGATEGTGMTFITVAEWLEHPGSVGQPMRRHPAHLRRGRRRASGRRDRHHLLRAGQAAVRVPRRRRRRPGPAAIREHDNWAALGDIGYLDEDGYLYLTDRESFMIISGGVNIYPAEIESCLVMHPKVLDVAVFGLPDPEMGEYVQAVVQLADGVEPSPELADELRDVRSASTSPATRCPA